MYVLPPHVLLCPLGGFRPSPSSPRPHTAQRLERTLQTTYFTDYTLARMVIAAPLPGEAPGEAASTRGPAHSGILAAALDTYRAGGGGAGAGSGAPGSPQSEAEAEGGSVDEVVGVVVADAGEVEGAEREPEGKEATVHAAAVVAGSKAAASKKKEKKRDSEGARAGKGTEVTASAPAGVSGKKSKGVAAPQGSGAVAQAGGPGSARVVGGKSKAGARGGDLPQPDVEGAQAASASAAQAQAVGHGSRKKQRA